MRGADETIGAFIEDPNRPGSVGRYLAVYEGRDEKTAREQMARDEATLGSLHQEFPHGVSGYLRVVSAHWVPPTGGIDSRGRLVAIFDLGDEPSVSEAS